MTTATFIHGTGVRIPDATSPFQGWWAPRVPGEEPTRLIVRPAPFIAPVVVEEPDRADHTVQISAPVRAAILERRGRTISRIVDSFHDLAVTQILTLGLLTLTVVLFGLFGSENGWWSQSAQMLVAAAVLYVAAVFCSHAHPDRGRVPWFRKTVAVTCIMLGITFTLVGSSMGAMQFMYDAVHATGLI